MKRITLVLDGVADRPNEKLGGKTPLQAAKTPNLDALFSKSAAGRVITIPPGLEVGSAVGNMSMLGLDTSTYRGRAAVEAAGLGMPVNKEDLYIRVNLVHFDGDRFEDCSVRSYSAYDISTEKAAPVAAALKEAAYGGEYELHYVGSFRCILVVKGGAGLYPLDFAPAHDIIGQPVKPLIKGTGREAPFFELMEKSFDFLRTRDSDANGVWFWGASVLPDIKNDTPNRAALSETLLLDGITAISGIPNIGTVREGRSFEDFLWEKLEKSIKAVKKYDDIYVHIQETDDLSHELMPVEKMEAVEAFDTIFLPAFLDSIEGPFTLKLASDHFTFSDTGAHGGDPVPFLFYNNEKEQHTPGRYTEADCAEASVVVSAKELRAM